VHPKIVSEIRGHSRISLTLDVYSHSLPTLQAEAADKIAAALVSAASRSGGAKNEAFKSLWRSEWLSDRTVLAMSA